MARTTHNGNGHGPRHVTETPDVSHIKNLDVTHEASDVSVSGVAKFVLGLTVLGIVVFLSMWGMFDFLNAQEEEKTPMPGPMAMTPQERLPPDPRLQAAPGFGVKLKNGQWVPLDRREPQAEYRVLREQWERELNCNPPEDTLTVERNLCLPIADAMSRVLEGKSLLSRTKEIAAGGSDGPAEDHGIDPPTAASSGRMTEKGRQ